MTARVALVTGGTGGIGSAICKKLADMGHKVATNYRNEEKTQAWLQQMREQGYDITAVKGDVASPEEAEALVREVEAKLGPVDILVNNAGITRDTTFHRMTSSHWNEVINTNLNSVFNMTRPVIEGMRDRGWGRIINISSINGQKGQVGQTNYSAAKAGMIGFTKALALENAKKGITVNCIAPGYIDTEMVMAVPQNVLDAIVGQIPVGRLGRGAEIADMVAFLAGEHAGYVTGATLSLNGGQYMAA
jgi:acetoacetyl-CoA reductase